jgi:hypothetical protein
MGLPLASVYAAVLATVLQVVNPGSPGWLLVHTPGPAPRFIGRVWRVTQRRSSPCQADRGEETLRYISEIRQQSAALWLTELVEG